MWVATEFALVLMAVILCWWWWVLHNFITLRILICTFSQAFAIFRARSCWMSKYLYVPSGYIEWTVSHDINSKSSCTATGLRHRMIKPPQASNLNPILKFSLKVLTISLKITQFGSPFKAQYEFVHKELVGSRPTLLRPLLYPYDILYSFALLLSLLVLVSLILVIIILL